MKKMYAVMLIIGLTLVAVRKTEVRASDPIAIYTVVERVVLEPGDNNPQRVQIWGAFSISDGKPGDHYSTPQRGYLYFSLPPGHEDTAKREWADLKSVAGKSQGVAFGTKYNMKVRLRKTDDKVESPDIYPIANGVTKVDNPIIHDLKEFLRQAH